MSRVKPIPDGYHTVTPYLALRRAAKALEFYAQALGAEELFRMPGPRDSIMHAEIKIGDSIIMLGDEAPERGSPAPETLGGTPVGLLLYVEDVDARFERATRAGCTAQMPPTDMFWGDRMCKLTDPFGHSWSIATHKEDVSPEEMERRAAAYQP